MSVSTKVIPNLLRYRALASRLVGIERQSLNSGKINIMNTVLLDKALELPPNKRVAFAELILASIDYEEEEVRHLWIKKVKERMNAVAEGKADLPDFEALYHED